MKTADIHIDHVQYMTHKSWKPNDPDWFKWWIDEYIANSRFNIMDYMVIGKRRANKSWKGNHLEFTQKFHALGIRLVSNFS